MRLSLLGLLLAVVALHEGGEAGALSPLQNPGFEDGTFAGDPQGWTVTSRADRVLVVGTETAADFPTYTSMGLTGVSPYEGDLMLGLGVPRETSANQPRGSSSVSQEFASTTSSLSFALRVFSWEARGDDNLLLDVGDGAHSVGTLATPLVLQGSAGDPVGTCSAMPCQINIDVGSQGDFLDSGWQEIEVNGLPADGRTLELTYSVTGRQNEAHPTWAYFDAVTTPPVAKFSFAPADPAEGDIMQFIDLSYDPDGGDEIVAWSWLINGETFTSQNPFYVFGDEGVYSASLTVTDAAGDSMTVSAGETAGDGDLVPALNVTNADPLVNALNVEALAGQPAELVGRFLDPGFTDSHSANWSITGNPPAAVDEENDPLLATGVVTGSAPANDLNGTLTVSDGDGGDGSDSFSVSMLPDTPAIRGRHEPNDDVTAAPVLNSDGSYVSFIQETGDLDFFEVRLPDGSLLPAGSELLASIYNVPADYDVVILAESPDPETAAYSRIGLSPLGYARTEFSPTSLSDLAYSRIAYSRIAYSRIAYSRIGDSQVGLSTFNSSGASWADIAYSRIAYSRIAYSRIGNDVTAVDITLDDLGLTGGDLNVADFSAARGVGDETAWARSTEGGTRFYVAVIGANGSFSSSPYSLSLEVIEPPDFELDLGDACIGSPLVTAGATNSPVTLHNYDNAETPGDDPALTLFVTQEQRMRALYDLDDAGWQAFLADLVSLAQHPTVQGDIVSVPSTIYDTADSNPCSVDAMNSAVTQIRDIVQSPLHAGAENVVVIGSDEVVPFWRMQDHAIIGNEKDYLLDSFLKPGTPLYMAILQGYMITDDYLVDSSLDPWQGGELPIPDKPTGRMVETPADITASAAAYLESNGVLSPATGEVFGYDFFDDGSQVIADNLAAGLPGGVQTTINDTWTADDLRCRFLGEGAAPCGVPDVASPNAHYTHYLAISAGGFLADDFDDVLSASEVADAGGEQPVLANVIGMTMGCHGGFNAPDGAISGGNVAAGVDPADDFPQAMARQQAVWWASTGYGLGDDEGIAGTEKLVGMFAERLMDGTMSAGEAAMKTKRDYMLATSPLTVYDVKSSVQMAFYGLPTYAIQPSLTARIQSVPVEEDVPLEVALTTVDSAAAVPSVTTNHPLELNETLLGDYYSSNGEAQATIGRAVQPKVVITDMAERHGYSTAPPPVHGLIVTGGTYTDFENFDPLISRRTFEWEEGVSEPQECLAGFFPAQPTYVNSLTTGSSLQQVLVVIPGQFTCDSGAAPTVTGTERLMSELTAELRRCDSPDVVGPDIGTVSLVGTGATTQLTVELSDESGLSRAVILRFANGVITPFEFELEGTETILEASIPVIGDDDRLLVQAEDVNCNTSIDSAKGTKYQVIHVEAGEDYGYIPESPTNFTATIFDFDELVQPIDFRWEFGDGTHLTGVLAPSEIATVPVTLDAQGNATFTVQHSYASEGPDPAQAHIRITDAAGAVGEDGLALIRCTDETDPACADTDGDGVLDTVDNCPNWPNASQALPPWNVPFGDPDCDGFTTTNEGHIGTDPFKACHDTFEANDEPLPDRWPIDLDDNRTLNTLDAGFFVAHLNSRTGDSRYDVRFDLIYNGVINTVDVGRYTGLLNLSC
jgi:PKD repeat protein